MVQITARWVAATLRMARITTCAERASKPDVGSSAGTNRAGRKKDEEEEVLPHNGEVDTQRATCLECGLGRHVLASFCTAYMDTPDHVTVVEDAGRKGARGFQRQQQGASIDAHPGACTQTINR
ncbi:unnamed protein product [Ectocarpus sp. 13 AM-2016]